MKNLPKLLILSICAIVVSSCSSAAKKTIGIVHSGPNEYSVIKNKSLEMPPHFEINEIEKERANSNSSHDETRSDNLKPEEKALLKVINSK